LINSLSLCKVSMLAFANVKRDDTQNFKNMNVKKVEKKISDVEGFNVRILHLDNRDVRGDMENLPSYPYERAAMDEKIVSDWKKERFKPNYPGFNVEVLKGNGDEAHGRIKLVNVRDSY